MIRCWRFVVLSKDIRQAFLSFFQKKDHLFLPSASIVPQNDPSLLFTSAGMVPFKDYFLGLSTPPEAALTSSQKCVRAGGKHNDLDCVGYTKRHHTFFEMLGNFSFGHYFKEQAIAYAWEFLTKTICLDPNKLSITYYHTDEETRLLWKKFVPESRIFPIDTSDNFWSMGTTGPCGPCTEIFYDFSDFLSNPEDASHDERFVEIWNLVFMQFNMQENGSHLPLATPCVDTGLGLERLACVLQKTDDNYKTDLFAAMKSALQEIIGTPLTQDNKTAFNVIADHVRCATFLIGDGVFPDNVGRGYVLRKILRRAMRYGHKLNHTRPFLHKLCATVVRTMGQDFPDIETHKSLIEQTVLREEERFGDILSNGLKVFKAAREETCNRSFDPKVVFDLYDTYGFPLDLTYELLRNHNLTVNKDDVDVFMHQQRQTSQKHWKGAHDAQIDTVWKHLAENVPATLFTGYTQHEGCGFIAAMITDQGTVSQMKEGTKGWIIANTTPFYAESGGQVGDQGVLNTEKGRFLVSTTQKPIEGIFAHQGQVVEGEVSVNSPVSLLIDKDFRIQTQAHHTATHLLHKALHTRFSSSTVQKGSFVCDSYLRFDFHLQQTLSSDDISFLEDWVNTLIFRNVPVSAQECSQQEARNLGATGLFGEKYGDIVRVVSVGDERIFSREFCGGCHVTRTGDIGLFHILSHQSIGSDTKRITACVGRHVLQKIREYKALMGSVQKALGASSSDMIDRIHTLKEKKSQPEGVVKNKSQETINGKTLLLQVHSNTDIKTLQSLVDQERAKDGVCICVANENTKTQKVSLIVGLSKDLAEHMSAADFAKKLSFFISDKENGGGRPDFAQCGGNNFQRISEAFSALKKLLSSH